MLISDLAPSVTYVYSGVNTFSIPFPFFSLTSLKVGFRPPSEEIDFSDLTLLTANVDYTIDPTAAADQDSYEAYTGGSITLTAAGIAQLASGDYVVLYRDTPITQQYEYGELDSFPAKSHENALSRIITVCQELEQKFARAVLVPMGSPNLPTELLTNISAAVTASATSAAAALVSETNADASETEAKAAAKVAAEAAAAAIAAAADLNHGECRLYLDGTVLRLKGISLRRMWINEVPAVIPVAGVTLSPSGLSADTTYYIYAYLDSGTMILEASATAWTTDATTGLPIKTGDAGRVLVGMARTNASAAWVDSTSQRFVLSYWNRREKTAQGALSAGVNVTSTTPVELSTNARAYFLTWGDEFVGITGSSCADNSTTGYGTFFFIGVDGSTVANYAGCMCNVPGNYHRVQLSVTKKGIALSEGVHYITPCGYVSAGTGNFPHIGIAPTVVNAFIKG